MQALVPAIAMHHKTLRGLLGKYRGAEVYAEADALLLSFQEPADAVAWCLASQQVGSTYRQPSSARTPAGKDMAGPSPHPTCPEDQAAGCAADTSAAKHLLVARLSEKASSTCRPAVRQGSTAHSSARAARHHCSLLNTTSGKAEPCSPALRMPAGSHQLQLACGSAAAPSDHNQDPGEPEPGERLARLHMDSMQWRPAPSCQGTASRAWYGRSAASCINHATGGPATACLYWLCDVWHWSAVHMALLGDTASLHSACNACRLADVWLPQLSDTTLQDSLCSARRSANVWMAQLADRLSLQCCCST